MNVAPPVSAASQAETVPARPPSTAYPLRQSQEKISNTARTAAVPSPESTGNTPLRAKRPIRSAASPSSRTPAERAHAGGAEGAHQGK